jgi:hypothetical protein
MAATSRLCWTWTAACLLSGDGGDLAVVLDLDGDVLGGGGGALGAAS